MSHKKQRTASSGGYRSRTQRATRKVRLEAKLLVVRIDLALAATEGISPWLIRRRGRRQP